MRSRSGSASSNTSNKELSADNIPINVSICDDKSELCHLASQVHHTNIIPAIKLNIRPIHTVANILEFLSASTTLPAEVRLIMDGTSLDPSSTVADLKLQETSVLKLDPPSRRSTSPTQEPAATTTIAEPGTSTPTTAASTPRSGTPAKKSNKPRCTKAGCKAFAPPIVGDCGFCQKRFCGKHRMLESHNCEGLEEARQADKDRNAAKLEGERTVMLRGL
jgi:hypothetical protein